MAFRAQYCRWLYWMIYYKIEIFPAVQYFAQMLKVVWRIPTDLRSGSKQVILTHINFTRSLIPDGIFLNVLIDIWKRSEPIFKNWGRKESNSTIFIMPLVWRRSRIEPTTSRSRDERSTTELPLRRKLTVIIALYAIISYLIHFNFQMWKTCDNLFYARLLRIYCIANLN